MFPVSRSSVNLSRVSLALKTTQRSISKHILIKGLPKFVTRESMWEKFSEFGKLHIVRLHDQHHGKRRHINVSIQYKELEAAQAMMDECQQTVMFNERVQMEFYPLIRSEFRHQKRSLPQR